MRCLENSPSSARSKKRSFTKGEMIAIAAKKMIIIIDKSLGIVGRLLLQDIHVERNLSEDNRRVSSRPQTTTSESLAVGMTQ